MRPMKKKCASCKRDDKSQSEMTCMRKRIAEMWGPEKWGIAETHKTTSDCSRRQLLYETRPSDDDRLRRCA
jgi:hypothetical protein